MNEDNQKTALELMARTVEDLSKVLMPSDPNGEKFPGLWALHAEISQFLDSVGA